MQAIVTTSPIERIRQMRYLLAPPLPGTIDDSLPVNIVDLAEGGLRVEHPGQPLPLRDLSLRFRLPHARREIVLNGTAAWSARRDSALAAAGIHAPTAGVTLVNVIRELCACRRALLYDELRTADRYELRVPSDGRFGTHGVKLLDLSARGARLAASMPLRAGDCMLLLLSLRGTPRSIPGTVVWTLERDCGPLLGRRFVSGVRFERSGEWLHHELRQLVDADAVRSSGSLMSKLQAVRLRLLEMLRRGNVTDRMGVPHDATLLLIAQLREQFRACPSEELSWWRLAIERSPQLLSPLGQEHSTDIRELVAIWEFLGRRFHLTTIRDVLTMLGGGNR